MTRTPSAARPARTARSGTTVASRLGTLMGGAFRYLLNIGPYGVFWVGNKQLEIFRMQGNELISIRGQNNCNDIWNVLELHLRDEGVIPRASATRGGAVAGRRAVSATRAVTGSTGGAGGGTARQRVSRLKQPVQAGASNNSST